MKNKERGRERENSGRQRERKEKRGSDDPDRRRRSSEIVGFFWMEEDEERIERERVWKMEEIEGETWRVHGGRDYIEDDLTEMTLVGRGN